MMQAIVIGMRSSAPIYRYPSRSNDEVQISKGGDQGVNVQEQGAENNLWTQKNVLPGG